MAASNKNLGAAKTAKNDEFYTRLEDIEREMNAYLDYNPDIFRNKTILLPCDDPEWSNFTKYFALHFQDFGIKKLISTSYAPRSNPAIDENNHQPSLFEIEDPNFDEEKSIVNGKKFVLVNEDLDGDGRVDFDDIQWEYLEGDGDFRSDEVTALRDEADMVLTNPPFSLFIPFIQWLVEGDVEFSIIGNKNAITYKEIFPLIRENQLWLGFGFANGNAYFRVPEGTAKEYAEGVFNEETQTVHFRNINWFTNIEHGRRHQPMTLMTMDQNLRFSRQKKIKEQGYPKYTNFDAIEVPFVESIPSDYEGIMGVPVSFLDKYNPDQFEIVANGDDTEDAKRVGVQPLGQEFIDEYRAGGGTGHISAAMVALGLTVPKHRTAYKRLLIRHRNPKTSED